MSSFTEIRSFLYAVPSLRSIFCKRCACIVHNCVKHIRVHLESCHDETDGDVVQSVINSVRETIGLEEEDNNIGFQWLTDRRPVEAIDAIGFLAVDCDALGCPYCQYAVKYAKCMRDHITRQHGEVSGDDRLPHLRSVEVHCIATVNGGTKQYWRVRVNADRAVFRPEPIRNFLLRMGEQATAALPARVVRATKESLEPNPFVDRMLFRKHLDGASMDLLRAATQSHVRDCCPRLAGLFRETTDLVVSAAADLHGNAGSVLRKEINRRKASQNPTTFLEPVSDDSLRGKYVNTWKRVFSYMEALRNYQEAREEADPGAPGISSPCTLTHRQALALRQCLDLQLVEPASERRQRVVELFNSVLQARLFRDDFESPLVSALAAMAFDTEKQRWHTASSYQGHISHAICVSLYMIYADAIMMPRDRGADTRPTVCEGDDTTGACVRCGRNTMSPGPSPAPACQGPLSPSDKERVGALKAKMSSVVYVEPDRHEHRTALVWAIDAQGLARQLRSEATPEPTTEWRCGGSIIVHNGVQVPMHQLRAMIGSILSDAEGQMSTVLLEGDAERGQWLADPVIPDLDHVAENMSCSDDGWSLLDHRDNQKWVQRARFLIPDRIESSEALCSLWRPNSRVFSSQKVKEWRGRVESLQDLILLMIYVFSVGPPRRPELTNMRLVNSESGLRNIALYKGQVALRADYWKGYHRQRRVRTVWRFLPRRASILFLTYFAVVRAFNIDIEYSNGHVGRPQPYLFSRNSPLQAASGGDPALISEKRLTSLLIQYTQKHIGDPLGVQAFRHILIGIGRKFINKELQQRAPLLLDEPMRGDVDASGSEATAGDSFEEMAAHAAITGRQHYAVVSGPDEATWLDTCFEIAAQGHICIMPRDRLRSLKRPHSEVSEDRDDDGAGDSDFELSGASALDNIQRDLKDKRAQDLQSRLLDENHLRMMMRRGDAALRRHQREVLELMSGEKADKILYVAGTGGGKSVIYMLPAFVQPESLVIVVQPLRSLQTDTARRLTEAGISNVIWTAGCCDAERLQAASVVLVTPEAMESREWSSFACSCRQHHLIDRVIVDEVQECMVAGLSYRPDMLQVMYHVNQLSDKQILISGTLPPKLEHTLFSSLDLNWRDWTITRTRTSRLNTRLVHHEARDGTEATTYLREFVQPLLSRRDPAAQRGRGIIYVFSLPFAQTLAQTLDCPHYTAKLSEDERAKALQEWQEAGGLIVATSALGLGVDFHGVEVVAVVTSGTYVERDANSTAMLGILQAFGRAGRDGSPCTGILLSKKDVSNPDLRAYINADCRRNAISKYLDDVDETCGFDSSLCDKCAPFTGTFPALPAPAAKRRRIDREDAGDVGSSDDSDTYMAGLTPPRTAEETEAYSEPSSSIGKAAASLCSISQSATGTTICATHSEADGSTPTSSLSSAHSPGSTLAFSSTPCRGPPRQGKTAATANVTPLRPGFDLASNIIVGPESTPSQSRDGRSTPLGYCERLNRFLTARLGPREKCLNCLLKGNDGAHALTSCPDDDRQAFEDQLITFGRESRGEDGHSPIGHYSCCYTCLRPQIYCGKYTWDEAKDGCFRTNRFVRCQSERRFQELAVVLIANYMDKLERAVRELSSERTGSRWSEENAAGKSLLGRTSSKHHIGVWLRKRIRITQQRGLQTHNLFITVARALDLMGKLP